MVESIACRLCRTPLLVEGGCEVCRGWKGNLVVVGDSPADDAVDLGELGSEALGLARRMLRQVKLAQLGRKGPPGVEDVRTVDTLCRGVAVLIDSARKVRKEGAASLASLPFAEKVDLFVGWFRGLPPAHRRSVFGAVAGVLEEMGGVTEARVD